MNTVDIFRYCPRCGREFARVVYHLSECSQCGLRYYDSPRPCTGLLLTNDQGEYLLVERAVEPQKGWWDLPGGFVEPGETFEASVAREAKEELKLELAHVQYVESLYDTYEYQGVTYPTIIVIFKASVSPKAQLQPADDVASYKFFAADDMPFDKIAFPSFNKLLRNIGTS